MRMLSRYEHNGLVWIDLESPTQAEIHSVTDEFGLDHHVADELLLPSEKPRGEFYNEYAYFVFHFPALRHSHTSQEQEIDFVVGKKFLITTRYDTVDPLHKFTKVFEVNSILGKSDIGTHAGFLFFYMLKKLYKSLEHEIDFLRRDLAHIEEQIFSGDEVSMVSTISYTARDLLRMRQTIEPHRDMLRTLEEDGRRLFGDDFLPYLRGLSNEYYRVHNRIMRETESLHELRETNNALLTTRQNETMKTLTMMAFLTLPVTLIASLFQMGTRAAPIIGGPYDFWIIVSIMLIAEFCMFAFFKRKNWF
jgi:magnesium transporter